MAAGASENTVPLDSIEETVETPLKNYEITPGVKQAIDLSNIRLPPCTKLDESVRKALVMVMSQAKADCRKLYRTRLRITKLNVLKLFLKHHDTKLTNLVQTFDRPVLYDWRIIALDPTMELSLHNSMIVDRDIRVKMIRILNRAGAEAYIEAVKNLNKTEMIPVNDDVACPLEVFGILGAQHFWKQLNYDSTHVFRKNKDGSEKKVRLNQAMIRNVIAALINEYMERFKQIINIQGLRMVLLDPNSNFEDGNIAFVDAFSRKELVEVYKRHGPDEYIKALGDHLIFPRERDLNDDRSFHFIDPSNPIEVSQRYAYLDSVQRRASM